MEEQRCFMYPILLNSDISLPSFPGQTCLQQKK